MQFSNSLKIECCYPNQNNYILICLAFKPGAKIAHVVSHLGLDPSDFKISIWSKSCTLETALSLNDRVEFNLPLQRNPRTRLLEVTVK